MTLSVEPVVKLSLAEFLQQPETKPAREYLDGKILEKPMPSGKHSMLQGMLTLQINQKLFADKIACAFPELRCTFAEH